jgi:hypothetical protein
MMHHILTWLLALLPMALWAQSLQGEALLTTELYGDRFQSLTGEPERQVAEGLHGLSLSELVARGIIRRGDMQGFALPLGVHGNEASVDFMAGMLAMWDDKALRMIRREESLDPAVMHQALLVLEALHQPARTLTLRTYREEVINPAVEAVRDIHAQAPLPDEAQQQFMDMVMDNLSPNVMLGFNLQEMLPPRVGNANRWVNSYFKAYYLDRLLQEAGAAFVGGFPARYDGLLSFGPFQMTEVAMRELRQQAKVSPALARYEGMASLLRLEDHVLAASMFAYVNWRRLAGFLQRYGGLAEVNTWFAQASQDAAQRRTLRILIAGTTACMHHQPNATYNVFQAYAAAHSDLSEMYHAMIDDAIKRALFTQHPERLPQLQKYYRSAAEAYLILKVYHLLEE